MAQPIRVSNSNTVIHLYFCRKVCTRFCRKPGKIVELPDVELSRNSEPKYEEAETADYWFDCFKGQLIPDAPCMVYLPTFVWNIYLHLP